MSLVSTSQHFTQIRKILLAEQCGMSVPRGYCCKTVVFSCRMKMSLLRRNHFSSRKHIQESIAVNQSNNKISLDKRTNRNSRITKRGEIE
jgi:hypothetical protein